MASPGGIPPWKQAIMDARRRKEEEQQGVQQAAESQPGEMPEWKREIRRKQAEQQAVQAATPSDDAAAATGSPRPPRQSFRPSMSPSQSAAAAVAAAATATPTTTMTVTATRRHHGFTLLAPRPITSVRANITLEVSPRQKTTSCSQARTCKFHGCLRRGSSL